MPFIMIVVTTSCAPVFTFRIAGTSANAIPPSMPNRIAVHISNGPGQEVELQRRPRRGDHADEVLTLDADVEHAALEAHGDGERREDQRGRLGQDVAEPVLAPEPEVEDRAVDGGGTLAVGEDDQRAEQQRDQERDDERERLSGQVLHPLRALAFHVGRHGDPGGGHQPASATSTSPSMPRPTSSGGASGRVLGGDPALEQRDDPVGQGVDLVQLGGDQEHRAAGGLLVQDLPPHELDRADVEAARGLRGQEELRIAVQLAREDQLLLVPAGEGARGHVDVPGADVVLLDEAARRAA